MSSFGSLGGSLGSHHFLEQHISSMPPPNMNINIDVSNINSFHYFDDYNSPRAGSCVSSCVSTPVHGHMHSPVHNMQPPNHLSSRRHTPVSLSQVIPSPEPFQPQINPRKRKVGESFDDSLNPCNKYQNTGTLNVLKKIPDCILYARDRTGRRGGLHITEDSMVNAVSEVLSESLFHGTPLSNKKSKFNVFASE